MKTLLALVIFVVTRPLWAAMPDQPTLPVDPRCTLSVGNSEIDYGRQSRGQLQLSGSTYSPGKRVMLLSVICPAPRVMTLAVQGERARDGSLSYGENGRLRVRIRDAQLDGHPVELRDISHGQPPSQSVLPLKADSRIEVTQNGLPVSGKTLTAQLELLPELSMEEATVNRSTEFQSRFSLDVIN
ncbi:fimbrial protein [Enterobacteriaceae bacterium 89]|nr:fimbrial protein [Enterobacteriaceae bacterium 89]